MNALFLDAKGQYNGKARYFWAANDMLEGMLLEQGLLWVIKTDISSPTRPVISYQNLEANEASLADHSAIEKYETKIHSQQQSYEKAYRIIIKFLGSTCLSDVKHIIIKNDIDLREKSKQIINHLKILLEKCRIMMLVELKQT